MLKVLALIGEWLLKNSVQKALSGAGLSVISYLAIIAAVRAAFDSLINSVYQTPAELLSYMGMLGIDHVIASFVSVAVFLLMWNQNKLFIGKK